MISRIIDAMMMGGSENALTETGIMKRLLVLYVLLGFILFFFVFILIKLKKKQIRVITALILSAILIFEAYNVIPNLHGKKYVPLEYVGSVETTRNDPLNSKVKWVTNDSMPIDPTEPFGKKQLEHYLECDLSNIAVNDEYGYLFVLYYKDVDLFYNEWSGSKYYLDCWIGRVEAAGEPTKNTIYIFRFPRLQFAIVPTEPVDIMWWEELVD